MSGRGALSRNSYGPAAAFGDKGGKARRPASDARGMCEEAVAHHGNGTTFPVDLRSSTSRCAVAASLSGRT